MDNRRTSDVSQRPGLLWIEVLQKYHSCPARASNLDNELTPVYGNVGREILDLFEIFFDYGQNTVAFKPYK